MYRIIVSAVLAASMLPLAAHAETPSEKPDRSAPDTVRCRKILQTGSLVKKEKICRTNAEWRKAAEDSNRDADDLISRTRSGMNPSG